MLIGEILSEDGEAVLLIAMFTQEDVYDSPCKILKFTKVEAELPNAPVSWPTWTRKTKMPTFPTCEVFKNCLLVNKRRIVFFTSEYVTVFDLDLNQLSQVEGHSIRPGIQSISQCA